MPPKSARAKFSIRFRLMTIMIVIAVLAVLMGIIPRLAFFRRFRATSVQIRGASLWIQLDLMPGGPVATGSGTIIYSHEVYAQIPLANIAILLGIVAVPVALVVAFRSRRRKRARTPSGGPGSTPST